METQTPAPPDTKIGTALRVGFFAACVFAGLLLLPGILLAIFGILVAGIVGLFAAALCANLLTMRIFDRRPFAELGLVLTRASGINFGLGLLFGSGAAALMLTAPLLAGTGHLVARPEASFAWSSLFFYLFMLLLGAIGEELIFRGYAFQLLVQKIGPFATVLPAGVIFGLTHNANPHATFLGIVNTMLWGMLLGFAFIRSHDLWLPIGLHFGWNTVLPLFGVNLSGLTIEVTRYLYRWDLTPLWSGGDYGPEGGLLATLFVVTLFFALLRAPIKPQTAYIAVVLNDVVLNDVVLNDSA